MSDTGAPSRFAATCSVHRWSVVVGLSEGLGSDPGALEAAVELGARVAHSAARVVPLVSRRAYRMYPEALGLIEPRHAVIQARWRGSALSLLLPLLRVSWTDRDASLQGSSVNSEKIRVSSKSSVKPGGTRQVACLVPDASGQTSLAENPAR